MFLVLQYFSPTSVDVIEVFKSSKYFDLQHILTLKSGLIGLMIFLHLYGENMLSWQM